MAVLAVADQDGGRIRGAAGAAWAGRGEMATDVFTKTFATPDAAAEAQRRYGGSLDGRSLEFRREDVVFYDGIWEGWGWRHASLTDGPFRSAQAAWRAFKDELADEAA